MSQPPAARRKKGWYWPWLIVGFFVVTVVSNLVVVWIAANDPSFAVEPDYYQKALDWDQKREQDRVNADLGWSIELEVAREKRPDGTVDVVARLLDAEGVTIPDARISLEAFHNARASYVLEAELREKEGTYNTTMPLRRPGLWEFRFVASRGGARGGLGRLCGSPRRSASNSAGIRCTSGASIWPSPRRSGSATGHSSMTTNAPARTGSISTNTAGATSPAGGF